MERIGSLDCHVVDGFGEADDSARPPIVVLLHGFGAPGADLVPLASSIPVPAGTIFACPEAPLELGWGADSRAWWMIDVERLERAALSGRAVELPREAPSGLDAARSLVTALAAELRHRSGTPERPLVLGGFSQGAMLACDVALRLSPAPAGLALFSPTILNSAEWEPLMPRLSGAPVLISHGSQDPLLPFAVSETLCDMLRDAGADVRWLPFRGGHEIPSPALEGLRTLLADVAG
jgi:phospholipase/carboxylesterase